MEMASNPPDTLLLIGNAEYEVKLLYSDVKNITSFVVIILVDRLK